jgi:hypothetical protein
MSSQKLEAAEIALIVMREGKCYQKIFKRLAKLQKFSI